MKTILTALLISVSPVALMAAQPRVNGVEVMQANGGTATNVTVTGTNAFRGNANELHAIGFVNEQLAGSTVLNFSYGDGSSITSNRWRIGASSINFNIYDVKTARFPLSIASADGSAGGDGNVNINGVSITTNGATYVPGGLTVSNSLTWTSVLGTITFLRRVLPTNGTIVDRYHFGDDMGQTYSWQTVASTNRFYLQRENTDTDFPFMVTRTGVKLGSANTVTTNTGALIVGAGASASNAWVGGRIYQDFLNHTNHSTANDYTNLTAVTIGAHTLTNLYDSIVARWSGKMLSGTNRFGWRYGSITNVMLINGVTNGHPLAAYRSSMCVTRTGATSQRITVDWSTPAGFGITYSSTNWVIDIAETNGIANTLAMIGSCIRAGGITNMEHTIDYIPAVR